MNLTKEDNKLIVNLGRQLRAIRLSKGLSMEKLAELADLDYSQISKIERGVNNTTVRTLSRIAKALQIPVKELFDFDS